MLATHTNHENYQKTEDDGKTLWMKNTVESMELISLMSVRHRDQQMLRGYKCLEPCCKN